MRIVPARWIGAVLVCGKCSKKVGGGFGDKGHTSLAKALRRYLGFKKGRKAAAGVVEVKCLGLCPKRMVVAIDTTRPGEWRLVAPGTPIETVAAELGLIPRPSTHA
ncbi:MAG TPA: (2Fe-2S) ferredoxin domain-containing protein [Sphingomonas sp.]|jgi:predicted metal-binding protein